ncbi:MAG: hypothetical protein QOE79_1081 [Sphingomonadales bacterium]|jgi:hypothetical protein|nr:hypothetical protein [Sphingomonadales bacterium]
MVTEATTSRDVELSELEQRFVDAVDRGDPFVPTAREIAQGGVLRCRLVRALLLGEEFPVRGRRRHGRGPAGGRAIRIGEPGSARRPAALLPMSGALDLRDLAPRDARYLPPLEFRGCRFETAIDLSGAHVQSLLLEDCRLPGVRAEGAHFSGDIRIRRCGPVDPSLAVDFGGADFVGWPEGDGVRFKQVPSDLAAERPADRPNAPFPEETHTLAACEIFLRGATIGGGLEIEGSSLRARRIRPPRATRSMRDVSALELSHAQVRHRVELVRSTFVGGARFVSSDIGDDVWILGGKFLSFANRHAMDFQFARIVGQLGFKGDNVPREKGLSEHAFYPLVVIGQVSAIGMSAGEVWIAGGLFHGQDNDEQGAAPTLNFAKANIARTVKLGLYHSHYIKLKERQADRVYVHGELCLVATNVGKNLEVHGACAGDVRTMLELGFEYEPLFDRRYCDHALFKIGAEAIKIDRRINLTHSHFVAGSDFSPEDEAKQPKSSLAAATGAIDLFKATVGTGIKIKDSCKCEGAVRLNSCIIGREAIIGCRIINPPPKLPSETHIIPWLLDLRGSSINGHLKIGRREISEGDAVTISGGITLESAKVQGGTTIRKLTLDLSTFPSVAGSRTYEEVERERTAINLRDFACGSEFEVHRLRWKLPALDDGETALVRRSGAGALMPTKSGKKLSNVEESSFAVIDMRSFRCGLLSDEFGEGWGLIYRLKLRLANLHVKEVEAGSDDHAACRLRWLRFQNSWQRVSATIETPLTDEAKSAVANDRFSLWDRYHRSRGEDFVRHAYDVFAQANSRAGEDRAAEAIVVERKDVQATLHYVREWERWPKWAPLVLLTDLAIIALVWNIGLKVTTIYAMAAVAAIVLFWPICVAVLQLIASYFLNYGLSPNRALFVLLVCIIAGSVGVHWARYGGLRSIPDWGAETSNGTRPLNPDIALVLNVPYAPAPVEPLYEVSKPNSGEPSMLIFRPAPEPEMKRGAGTRQEVKLLYAEPSPCNLDVSSILYAADLFIPVLDLDQESRCSIRHSDPVTGKDYSVWRIAKALYQALGWVVTSLVILVLTGVLRRDIEGRVKADANDELA